MQGRSFESARVCGRMWGACVGQECGAFLWECLPPIAALSTQRVIPTANAAAIGSPDVLYPSTIGT